MELIDLDLLWITVVHVVVVVGLCSTYASLKENIGILLIPWRQGLNLELSYQQHASCLHPSWGWGYGCF